MTERVLKNTKSVLRTNEYKPHVFGPKEGQSSTMATASKAVGDVARKSSVQHVLASAVLTLLTVQLVTAMLTGQVADEASSVPRETGSDLTAAMLTQPAFFLRQLELKDSGLQRTGLSEAIRRQRQIKFKSSYSTLPEALRQATENQRSIGKSLQKDEVTEIKVIHHESASSRESSALKDLPPSSEVYFSPEVDPEKNTRKRVKNRLSKSQASVEQSNPFSFKTKVPESKAETLLSKKQRRIVKKKMVGKKLLRPDTPKPQKIGHETIKFQASSTENIENKVIRVLDQQSLESFPSSGGKFAGGPNRSETFKNPFYVETPPHEISSYSFVPDSSKVSQASNGMAHQTIMPEPNQLQANVKRVTPHVKNTGIRTSPGNRVQTEKAQFFTTVTEDIQQKIIPVNQIKMLPDRSTSSHSDQALKSLHPIQATSTSRDENSISVSKTKRPHEKRGKSLLQNDIRNSEKPQRSKTSFPDLTNVPKTNFKCGPFRGGEYFADEETNCQVFHVCYGGRQASFVCPVGTAFSQNLLVCDWWHKVQCGQKIRPQRSPQEFHKHLWHLLDGLSSQKESDNSTIFIENYRNKTSLVR